MQRRRPDPPPPTEGVWRLFLAFRLDGGWIAEKLLSLSLTEVMGPDGVGFPVAPGNLPPERPGMRPSRCRMAGEARSALTSPTLKAIECVEKPLENSSTDNQ